MTALSPFTIDMYLPAFQAIAADFHTTVAHVSLSLSSYFVGLSVGQLIYGSLLDRFGRKRPVYIGLGLYVLASIFCVVSRSTENLIAWRFVQAFGGCAVSVAAMAMVRDLFTLKESAKVFSLLILILGASPLLAPTFGGYLADAFGWPSIFTALILYALLLLAAIRFLLPNTAAPDRGFSLHPAAIAATYFSILKRREFSTYAVSSAVAFSGLFVYLAGSPVIFLETFAVSGKAYGLIFAIVASGMIISSQINVQLLKRFTNHQILISALIGQVFVGFGLVIGVWSSFLALNGIVAAMFCFMFFFGLINPNAAAMALAPFSKNAGSASAMLGFLQMSLGALVSTTIGLLSISEVLPIVGILTLTSTLALIIYATGSRLIERTF